MTQSFNSLFSTSFLDQKKTIGELLKESRERADFYILLSFATFISTLGLLTDSIEVVIGGMLIAPMLFPILSVSMGIVTASSLALVRALTILMRSVVVVFLIAVVTTFLMGGDTNLGREIMVRTEPNLFHFLIALVSGLAVAYAWVKQNLSATLPGIALAVSLVPPLATVGVGVAFLNRQVIAGSMSVFLINCLATILGSLVIFSLFGFSRLQREEEEKIVEEVLEGRIQARAVAEGQETIEKQSPVETLNNLKDLESSTRNNSEG